MSANIPEHITRDQRVANQFFAVASLELEIIYLAKRRHEIYLERKLVEFEPDMWYYDNKLEKQIETLNDMARKAIGPPPQPIIKAKQKYYVK